MADSAKDRPLQGDRFSKLVAEEMAIQRTNLPINGGLPSCVTLLDNFLLCFCAFIAAWRSLASRVWRSKVAWLTRCPSISSLDEQLFNSYSKPIQVSLPIRRHPGMRGQVGGLQVLHGQPKSGRGAEDRRVDKAESRVLGREAYRSVE